MFCEGTFVPKWDTHPFAKIVITQRTNKVMPDSPGLVDFVVGLVNFILHLPDGQVKVLGEFFEEINLTHCTCENFFRLLKMTSGLVHPAGYSCPKGKLENLISLYPVTFKRLKINLFVMFFPHSFYLFFSCFPCLFCVIFFFSQRLQFRHERRNLKETQNNFFRHIVIQASTFPSPCGMSFVTVLLIKPRIERHREAHLLRQMRLLLLAI